MGILYWGHRTIPIEQLDHKKEKTRFSIIIPFRNEVKNLPKLINSIQNIEYPSELFEILFIDDESTDGSGDLIPDQLQNSHLKFRVLKNERHSASPKKDAISLAIEHSQYHWIFTTDADCILSVHILKAFDNCIQKEDPYMIVGPLGLIESIGLNYHFQNLENLGLQSISVGGYGIQRPFMCNGANLAYKKDLFKSVNGYQGNDHISSGDDIFLFEKIQKKYPGKVRYLKSRNAIVLTHPLSRWKHIIEQRVRWASKISAQNNTISLLLGLIVFSTNLYLVLGFLYSLIILEYSSYYLLFFFFKSLVDLIMISISAQFFGKRIHLLWFIINSLIYPFITLLITLRSITGKYEWKGRRISKLKK